MELVEVRDKKSWKLFFQAAHRVYKEDPLWVAPLEGELKSIFNPDDNQAFADGEAQLWVLLDKGQPVARIAAFIDHARNRALSYPVGGIGFFESLDQESYASRLLDAAEDWLKERGAEAIDGPINWGERDKYWGLLEVGHGYMPLFQENYQPAYYKKFFVERGYLPFEQVLTFHGNSREIPFDRFAKVIDRLRARYDIQVERLNWKDLDRFAADFCVVYNAAFGGYEHFKPIEQEVVVHMLEQAKPIADTNTLGIAYYEGKPAGFIAFFPDINPLLQKAKGKLNWRTLPGFLWRKRTTREFGTRGMGFGIHPEYKSKGIFAFLTNDMAIPENLARYPDMYLCTVRAHNTEAVSIYFKLGVKIQRVHVAYRKPLRADLSIEPFEFVDPSTYEVTK